MEKKCSNNKGLSLVEVVMSALIVSVLLAGIYAVYVSAKNMTALALHKAAALCWASSELEARKSGMSGSYTQPYNILSDYKGGSVLVTGAGVTVSWTE